MAESERVQHRFRSAVLVRLARLETMAQMIHGAQIVDGHLSQPGAEEKINEHTKDAEEYIAQKSNELGLAMVKFIYGNSVSDTQPKTRTKRAKGNSWSSWEI